ncbi:helicase-exonuclease AddAB subunit AddB [Halobacillus shinanisalinarum]|uniref:ATP-dependent helicase/deoxyribonuclease subunit B n=1 Tax=Halobacillus shinanisalinarum TaxID=2932258 RepID=A0ABY4GXQ2_9BACI|nr:helicase-exonuclease AddAB subunit AddB [Halobacillus shinanisalinarum]UOQ92791.1 helicase-exonuclease AddAB subunit AddB [Halobacillus shinanisalinarum]
MAIQFLLGRSGTGKGVRVLDEIEAKLKDDPKGRSIMYIVPDQMTFQQEYALLKRDGLEGSIRAQVFSFSRLAWRVFQETGGGTKKFISSTGVQMMLRKIVEERKSDWRVFQKAVEKQGFIEQLEGMITEFKRYNISPETLQMQISAMDHIVHKTSHEEGLRDKLDDLSYIFEHLTDALREQYIDSEDQLQLLADKIPEAQFLEGADVYLDGFHSFTPQEYTVIEALLKKANRILVTLTMETPDHEGNEELDLFHETKETYFTLKQLAEQAGVEVESIIELDHNHGRLQGRPALLHLERYFDERPAPVYKGEAAIQIAEAAHPRAEVEGVAQEILRLIREEGFRYKDMAVLMREPEVYHSLIETLFKDYGIPVFIDEKKTMLNHPVVELIRSGLDVIEGNFRYDAVFRLLKTGLIPVKDSRHPLTADAIDELENYVLEYGIRRRERWFSKEPWVYQRFRGFDQASQTDDEKQKQERINAYREQVTRVLEPFDQSIREANTIEERARAVYIWLDSMNIPAQLETWRDHYDEKGEIEHAREQEQVWDAVLQLLDEMVEMAGDEGISMQVFRSTLESGLESLTFAHVPPSMDHLVVGNVDRSRITGIKASFLLGVTDGVWPLKPTGDSMMSERERSLLAESGLKLADGTNRQLLDDRFYMYLALTMASDQLWISYPLSNEEGKSKVPSQIIQRVDELFPSVQKHLLLQDPDDVEDATRFITTPVKTRSALTSQLSRYLRGYPIQPVWWNVLNWYIEDEEKNGLTNRILHSLFYKNQPVNLAQDTKKRMFEGPLKTSVSRLETYHRCSYQYFSQHSLNLKERKTYKLDAPDIGQLFHEALKQITEWVQQEGRDFAELGKNETTHYAERVINKLAPILQNQILHSSNRHHYIKHKLEGVVARAAFMLSEQARKSRFSPVGLELGFGTGPDSKLPPLSLALPNGHDLMLRGRIDRVDRALNEQQLYLRIIDYKSSEKGLDLTDVYYGLALQMLAYLDVVLTNAEHWLGAPALPAGVLYFHVHNPMVSGKQMLADDQIEEEILKKFKMKGLLLENEQLVQMMDTGLEKGRSQIIPAGLKANGGFYKGSKTVEADKFNDLRSYIREVMTEAGQRVTEGEVDLNPYQKGQHSACDYCPFRSVCQFDPSLEDNDYRKLKEWKEEEVIQQIMKRGENPFGKLD